MAINWHVSVKPGLPVRQQTHLAAVVAVAKARQPGTAVGGSDGHDMVYARFGLHGLKPGPRSQSAHTVAHQQGRQAGGQRDLPNCRVNLRHIVINRAKQRLQVDRYKSVAASLQSSEPRVP